MDSKALTLNDTEAIVVIQITRSQLAKPGMDAGIAPLTRERP